MAFFPFIDILYILWPNKYVRSKSGKFKTPYTRRVIITYLQSVAQLIGKSPTYRDLKTIPGPAASTIIRHFGTWVNALKIAHLRPQTKQLMLGERTYIRHNWRTMTDKQMAEKLGISLEIIKYYRMNYNLWKNRKGTSKQKFKKDGMRLYGNNCEICNLSISELHHIKPKSTNPQYWSILCPTCHAVITRRLIVINSRSELKTKLKPYIKTLYENIRF